VLLCNRTVVLLATLLARFGDGLACRLDLGEVVDSDLGDERERGVLAVAMQLEYEGLVTTAGGSSRKESVERR